MFTEEINKIALCSNVNKRVPTFDRITSYPYSANAGKVCKTELPNGACKYQIINFDNVTNENKTEYNPNQS